MDGLYVCIRVCVLLRASICYHVYVYAETLLTVVSVNKYHHYLKYQDKSLLLIHLTHLHTHIDFLKDTHTYLADILYTYHLYSSFNGVNSLVTPGIPIF